MHFTRIAFLLLITICARAQKPLVQYASTLQGTNSEFVLSYGNTHPTTSLPFGMNAWSPQTGKNGNGWKYQYKAKTIRGFQQTHQCSPWSLDYAVFSLFPETGRLVVNEDERASAFSHEQETAHPHYYKVTFDNKITTEMSPTERGAHLQFKFPAGQAAYIVLDGYDKMSGVKISPQTRQITGWVNNGRYIPKNFRNYFVIQFNQPFEVFGTWDNKSNETHEGQAGQEGRGAGAYIRFKKGATVQVKVASSYISEAQALRTLQQELKGDFASTKKAAEASWNKLFNRVLVEGGTEEEKATFYSCLFRANLFSHQFFEYDEQGEPYYYSPYDGQVHNGYMYTDNGFWDTFRAQFPLNTILHPQMEGRYMQALLDAQQQCGWFPSWSFPGEGGSMVGNHAISLLTDAWMKGIRTFDPEQALKAYWHEAANKGPHGPSNGREGWKDYFQLGYVSYPGPYGAVSETLEYAYDDFCAYQLAKATGNKFYEQLFAKQMYNYRNVYDPVTGFMRARKADGSWHTPFDPFEWGGPFVEGNAWHWLWSVFHDTQGLINLVGGEERFAARLDSVFSLSDSVNVGSYKSMIHEMKEMVVAGLGQYAHGNQPIQHMIYLYNYARQPWKAQYHVRNVMDKVYSAGPNGYPGDEDQGQTSSWYVLSALGFYSVCPGTDQYVIGSPVFSKATITLENGKQFVVEALNNNRKNVYIQSATLNGKPYSKHYITHSDITAGGRLVLQMGPEPAKGRGMAETDKPFSLSAPGF
ncbi:GH92 family glycosyl hydrolase [Chitinophaga horti]|uniref:GH92 family glycosyl hydrolase n=1 Tax=Chitinophaga horti TaxID=2920382 RepID=A0ABY6IY80_9BACT|nr:GH92 family glycosyl hydrolase [Chitinophaga horti]UYQ91372.1 GH92 family glycosyl hydrolase [Chitinophaga horti]